MTRKLGYILIVLLALLLGWALVCTSLGGVLPVSVELGRLALPIAAFAVISFFLTLDRDKTMAVCLALLGASALIESLLGAAQLAGLADSRHATFSITGNFVNPGPFGGYLAFAALIALALLIRRRLKGWQRVAAIAVGAVAVVMMLLSRSRAAWLAFAVAGSLLVCFESDLFKRLKRKGLIVAAAAVVIAAAGFGAYQLKPDSARGRFHIWQMDCRVIAEHPLTGTGPGLEMSAFGDVQADFYASEPRGIEKMSMASVAEYPFNEFLGAGMSCGLSGLVLALAVYALAIIIEARRRSLLLWPLVAFGVFALFSYPLSQVATMLVLVLCLADAAAGDGLKKGGRIAWGVAAALLLVLIAPSLVFQARVKADKMAYRRLIHLEKFTPEMYATYYETQKYNPSFLYFYALNEFAEGKDEHAAELLESAALIDSEPMIHSLLGECHLRLGHPAQALEDYLRAYYVAPTRVYPLLKIMELYKLSGRSDAAQAVREYALSLPVERTQTKTLEIRKRIKNYEL